ncbi:MAG: PorV/PorQ family protein [Rhodothermales bacterium]
MHPTDRISFPASRSAVRHIALTLLVAVVVAGLARPASAQLIPSFGSDRAGTSGFQFLKIPTDARSAAMGQSVVSNAFDVSSLFWNPALAAELESAQFAFNHTAYFADVSMEFAGGTVHLAGPRITVGASLQMLNSGEMDVTTEFEPFGTGETFRSVSMAGGLTVAQQLTDLFSYGITGKYIREGVAEIVTQTVVFDLGVFYRVGDTGMQMAVAIRNFGLDGTPEGRLSRTAVTPSGVIVEDRFEGITPPTTFMLGLTYQLLPAADAHDLLISTQLTNPNDNAENLNFGAEYTWNELLILRAGYRVGVEESILPSLGVGLRVPMNGPDLRFDYGFSQLDRLGTIHRIGFNLGL